MTRETILLAATALISGVSAYDSSAIDLKIPLTTPHGSSIPHSPSYTSFSFEPAFWVEFFGNATHPNNFTFTALQTLHQHGLRPHIRPGGITMDSMIFSPSASNPIRTTNPEGGVYRTTVGPAYYESWDNFPEGTQFTSTLNFGNDSLTIARDLAVASVKYQKDKIAFFELGNEPTNYPPSRWDNSTRKYIAQWQNFTTAIDAATNGDSKGKWWASSATTDDTPLHVRPADLIPLGIDSTHDVAQYSIHSYAFATCDPARAALATTPNILRHTGLVSYADTEIYPSAKAALDAGSAWIIGEFNSIACSGNPNVSDTFAQALWEIDTELIYAVRNASATYLHQGATLVFQSSDQTNSAGDDGSPGYSTYDMLYPTTSTKRGAQRTLPGFLGMLYLAEAFATNETRIMALANPAGLSSDHFSGYAFYNNENKLTKLALINMTPYFPNSTEDFTATFNIGSLTQRGSSHPHFHHQPTSQAYVKRMTAPHVDEKDSSKTTWAGQSFRDGRAVGDMRIERVGRDGVVNVRGSEAVLVFLDESEVYGLEHGAVGSGGWGWGKGGWWGSWGGKGKWTASTDDESS